LVWTTVILSLPRNLSSVLCKNIGDVGAHICALFTSAHCHRGVSDSECKYLGPKNRRFLWVDCTPRICGICKSK